MACARPASPRGRVEAYAETLAKSVSLSIIDWWNVFSALWGPYVLGALAAFAFWSLLPPIQGAGAREKLEEVAELAAREGVTAGIRALSDAAAVASSEVLASHPLVAAFSTAASHMLSLWYAYAILGACVVAMLTSRPGVYLLDYAVFEPPPEWRVSRADLGRLLGMMPEFSAESLAFMTRVLEKSGTGDATHWPPGTVRMLRAGERDPSTGEVIPATPDRSLATARAIAERVLCDTVGRALERAGVAAKDVDFLVVNCSLFCPTPSLASIIVRRFGMKPTIASYNLGGMGCSAGILAVDLAKQLLENRPGSIAVVASTEEISQQLYLGNQRSMLLQNTLFRVGGAALVLSNRHRHGFFKAKYKLLHTVRVQDSSEQAQLAVRQVEDANGVEGIELSKDITAVAGRVLRDNLTILGPRVLPLTEQARVVLSVVARVAAKAANGFAAKHGIARLPFSDAATGRYAIPAAYVPDFRRAVQHFCIHAGGRAVIDSIEKGLRLERWRTAPSRATLYHWGNTSSSSVWYELRYAEGEKAYAQPAAGKRHAPAAVGACAASFSSAATQPSDAAPLKARDEAPAPAAAAGSSGAAAVPVRPAQRARAGSTAPSASTAAQDAAEESGAAAAAARGSAGSGSSSGEARASDSVDPDAEAAAAGWDTARKWHLPDYAGREVRRGDRVAMLAMGSGFKTNTAVWLKLR